MSADGSETLDLLQRWQAGDRAALDALIQRDLPWIRARVHHRLGALLRARGETEDYVQEAMLEVLHYGPKFASESLHRFRALLARIIENMLRDRNDWYRAKRRTISREQPLPSDSILDLDRPDRSVTRPSVDAGRRETESLVRLALELLEPDDRKVLLLRQWDELSFPEIATRMGIAPDAVRMRFRRALPKLAQKVAALRLGQGIDDEAGTEPDA